jgi:hypothetical protein
LPTPTGACLPDLARKNQGDAGGLALDLYGLAGDVRGDPLGDAWPFTMTREAHCEACFETDAAVWAMAARLLAALNQRTHEREHCGPPSTRTAAVAAKDPEWLAFLSVAGNEWRKLAGLP